MPWRAIHEAVWWSDKDIPDWLVALGVALPKDGFSLDRIREVTPPHNGPKQKYVFPGAEVVSFADWLEDEGFSEAAKRTRERLGLS